MKKKFLIFFILLGITQLLNAQVKFYATGGSEVIFSLAEIDNNGQTGGNILRFAPFFNIQAYGNVDFGKHVGLIFGGAIRNVGFIYEYSDPGDGVITNIKKKYRNYDFGIPVGLKLGVMNKWLLYGGYEIEFPFHYKEKTFINGAKQDYKITDWFSSRTPSYYNSVFVGIQFPYGFSLKFKYYFSEFFNEDYFDGATNSYPYQGLKSNIWYFSLNFSIFRNNRMVYKGYEENRKKARKNSIY
ncbi:MAG: hypothetical protein DRI88_03910 [Bacteroidetes bacterium]|nr:MAG: hypothetical protein DRI72_00675 [Bacteroidota bacterium]RLD48227.1 MAG: hypothetical protein DRI88_03910 [Bacteroidota bacterium]RLD89710.1 MAG: hypothetical protein DRJ02_00530 [Bacteroidota bacterium]